MRRIRARDFLVCIVLGLSQARSGAAPFLRGDANADQVLDLSDAIFVLGHLFLGGRTPACQDAADVNDDGELDLSDAIFALAYLFTGGAEPPAPGARVPGDDGTPGDPFPCGDPAPGPPGEIPTSFDLIERALAKGEIDSETGLVYKLYVTFGDNRLPAPYRGDDSQVLDAFILDEATDRFSSLSPGTRALAAPFLVPPIYEGSWLAPRSPGAEGGTGGQEPEVPVCGPLTADWYSLHPGSIPFRIWWQKIHPEDADEALKLGAELETSSFPKLSQLMGPDVPLPDAGEECHGEDGFVDIYLVQLGTCCEVKGYRGCKRGPAYCLLQRGIATSCLDFSALTFVIMAAIQKAYDRCDEDKKWWNFATAVWAPEYVYRRNCRWEQQYAPLFLKTPELPLEFNGATRGGGAYLFPFYLDHVETPARIPEIWKASEGQDLFDAIDSVIVAGMEKRWPEFVRYNWNRPPVDHYRAWDDLSEGAKPYLGAPIPVVLQGAKDREIRFPMAIEHLAACYYHLDFDSEDVRTVAFYNGLTFKLSKEDRGFGTRFLYELAPAEERKGARVQALVKMEGKDWEEWDERKHDWTDVPIKVFCRDRAAERLDELVIIFSNSEHRDRSDVLRPQGEPPTLFVSNLGCGRWQGDVEKTVQWDYGLTETTKTKVTWEITPLRELDGTMPFFSPKGTMDWSISGTDKVTSCTWGGGQSVPLGLKDGSLALDLFVLDGKHYRSYSGIGFFIDDVTLKGHETCPCVENESGWCKEDFIQGAHPIWWDYPFLELFKVQPDGTTIQNRYCPDEEAGRKTEYTWKFQVKRES